MDMELLEPVTTELPDCVARQQPPNWVVNANVLWDRRRTLARVTAAALVVSLTIAFTIPKRYTSTGRIMPPDNSGSTMAMFAALSGRSGGEFSGLSNLAGSLLGGRNSSALFVDLLKSSTISGALIDRFRLQQAWHKRYRVDAAKYLARHSTIVDDKRSGVITVEVQDTNPQRARDLAQGYLDELNMLLNRTSISAAHQERIFIERRLKGVEADLEQAQTALSDYSSTHTTIDLPNQTRAMVDAAARLQAEQIAAQSEVDSLRLIYGDTNVRLRAAEARAAELQHQLTKMSGTSAPLPKDDDKNSDGTSADVDSGDLYPPLRQRPRLAVPYANLYRRVRVEETIYELLTQQYEVARIQEAKDVPVVSVIDMPGIPEKKSFPPRLLVALILTIFAIAVTAATLLFLHRWQLVSNSDPRKVLARRIEDSIGDSLQQLRKRVGGAR
jgi:capsule polysaccharide export protein KpsE/RkpR